MLEFICLAIPNRVVLHVAQLEESPSWRLASLSRIDKLESIGVEEWLLARVMKHPLATKYGLSEYELLDALDRRFRAKVTLEGAVAEVQMEKHIKSLVGTTIENYEVHDIDGHPDFSIWLPGRKKGILAECKNVRDATEGYRAGGEIVAYKVETQKTRAAKADETSRYYDVDQFEVLLISAREMNHIPS